jgi:hypothetical protein
MGIAAGFEHDVFISYAAADNVSRPGQDGEWVARFHASLSLRLRTMLGADLSVFRDPKLTGVDSVAGDKLRTAATIVPVLSPDYLRSRACMQELATFTAATNAATPRVFPVWLGNVSRSNLPASVADLVGFRFFTMETGRQEPRRFRQDERDGETRYWELLDDLSSELAATLRGLGHGLGTESLADEPAVFLAETSPDIEYERSRIRRALLQQGFTVLPQKRLPRSRAALREAVERDVRRSSVVVHMLGAAYGDVLSDGDISIPRAQAEIAAGVAREAADGAALKTRLRRIVWLAPHGPTDGDARQRDFQSWLETAEAAPDELLRGGLEELKTVVFESLPQRRRAVPSVPQVVAPSVEVFMSYARADARDFATALSDQLRRRGLRIWIDVRDIRAGANFRREIEEGLYRCTHVLVVLSPKAVESDEVMGEVNVALDDKKPIVPVLYLPCRMPSYLRRLQHVDFTRLKADDEGAVSAVVNALRGESLMTP